MGWKDKEKQREYNKKWYQEHKKEQVAKHKKYYQEHKEGLIAKGRKYYQENKERLNAVSKKYQQKHKEEIKIQRAKFYKENKERINEAQNSYYENRFPVLLRKDGWCQFNGCGIDNRYMLAFHHLFPGDKEIGVILCFNHHQLIDHRKEGFCES